MDHTLRAQGARTFWIAIAALLVSACASVPAGRVSRNEQAAITAAVATDIATLASDRFQGRRPGTAGEGLTLDYIQASLEKSGLQSGTNDPSNSWRAPVVLASSIPVSSRIAFTTGRRTVALPGVAAAAYTLRRRSLIDKGEVVFVGNGTASPSQPLVQGRVALLLPDAGRNGALRDALFEQGAAAVVSVVGDEARLEEIRQFRDRERFGLRSEESDALSGYVTEAAMTAALGEKAWRALVERAGAADFSPALLDTRATIEATSQVREVRSHNLVARLPGKVPGSGAILLLAHWDHFGACGNEGDADRLCNGAADNASGIAVMLQLARRLARSAPLDRDIYVLATTAEEWGLLGARAFADNPPIPLDTIVAAFNFDTVAIAPAGTPVGIVGAGRTAFDREITDAIARARRQLGPEGLADQFLRRQDGWVLLQRDVPAVSVSSAFGNKEVLDRFIAERYHKAVDEPGSVELGGAVEDLLLHEALIRRLGSVALYPATNPAGPEQSH